MQLFDFSGYNEFTTERVPPPADRHSAMRWYWDAGHYKVALGDEMLGVIFGDAAPFGVALTSSNVEGAGRNSGKPEPLRPTRRASILMRILRPIAKRGIVVGLRGRVPAACVLSGDR